MAVTQSSVTANLGDGVHATRAMPAAAREIPISTRFAMLRRRDRGTASATVNRLGAAIAAAAFSEAAAAVTPTTLPSVTPVSVSPAGYQSSVGWTDEAWLRANPDNDPGEILTREALYAAKIYMGADSLVGVGAYQFTQVSTVGGNTGGTLSFSVLRTDARTLRAAVNSRRVTVVSVIEDKGYNDLKTLAETAGATIWQHLNHMPDLVKAMFDKMGVNTEESGYVGSIDPTHHIFVEHSSAFLTTSAGDKIGCTFIPSFEYLQGQGLTLTNTATMQANVMPAFMVAYDDDPCPSSRSTYLEVRDEPSDAGRLSIVTRTGSGQRQKVIDVFGSAASGITNQSAAVQLPYSAT